MGYRTTERAFGSLVPVMGQSFVKITVRSNVFFTTFCDALGLETGPKTHYALKFRIGSLARIRKGRASWKQVFSLRPSFTSTRNEAQAEPFVWPLVSSGTTHSWSHFLLLPVQGRLASIFVSLVFSPEVGEHYDHVPFAWT